MEKTNLSKRVVAGTLALLTVFGSAPASLQGVFAPTTLTASAAEGDDRAMDITNAKQFITGVTINGTEISKDALALIGNSIAAKEGKNITIKSSAPLVITTKDVLEYAVSEGVAWDREHYSWSTGSLNQAQYDAAKALVDDAKADLDEYSTTTVSVYTKKDNVTYGADTYNNLLTRTAGETKFATAADFATLTQLSEDEKNDFFVDRYAYWNVASNDDPNPQALYETEEARDSAVDGLATEALEAEYTQKKKAYDDYCTAQSLYDEYAAITDEAAKARWLRQKGLAVAPTDPDDVEDPGATSAVYVDSKKATYIADTYTKATVKIVDPEVDFAKLADVVETTDEGLSKYNLYKACYDTNKSSVRYKLTDTAESSNDAKYITVDEYNNLKKVYDGIKAEFDNYVAVNDLSTTTGYTETGSKGNYTYSFNAPASAFSVAAEKQSADITQIKPGDTSDAATDAADMVTNLKINDTAVGATGSYVIDSTVKVTGSDPFTVTVDDYDKKGNKIVPTTSYDAKNKVFVAEFTMPRVAADSGENDVSIVVKKVVDTYKYSVNGSKLIASTSSGSVSNATAAELKVYYKESDGKGEYKKDDKGQDAKTYVANGAAIPNGVSVFVETTKIDDLVGEVTAAKVAFNGGAESTYSDAAITAAGSYAVKYTVKSKDNNTSYDLKFSFTIAPKGSIVAEDILLTISGNDKLYDKDAKQYYGDGELTEASFKSGKLSFKGVTNGVAVFMLAKGYTTDGEYTVDVSIPDKVAAGKFSVSGYTSGTELNVERTLTVSIKDPEWGGSDSAPKTVDVKWKVVPYEADVTFKTETDEGDVLKVYVPRESFAKDVEKAVYDAVTADQDAAAPADAVEYEYVVGANGAKFDDDELDEHIPGLPKEADDAGYSVYVRYNDEIRSKVDVYPGDQKKLTLKINESALKLTFGDKIDTEAYTLTDETGKAVTDVDAKLSYTLYSVVDADNDGKFDKNQDGTYTKGAYEISNNAWNFANAGDYVGVFRIVYKDSDKYISDDVEEIVSFAKKQITKDMITIKPIEYDGKEHDIVTEYKKANTIVYAEDSTTNTYYIPVKITEGPKQTAVGKYTAKVEVDSEDCNYVGSANGNWAITLEEYSDANFLEWNDEKTTLYDNGRIHFEIDRNADDRINIGGKKAEIVKYGLVLDNTGKFGDPSLVNGEYDLSNQENSALKNTVEAELKVGNNFIEGGYNANDSRGNAYDALKQQTYKPNVKVKGVKTGVWARPYIILKDSTGKTVISYGELRYVNLQHEATKLLKLKMAQVADDGKAVREADLTDAQKKDTINNTKVGYIPTTDRFYSYAEFTDLDKEANAKALQVSNFGIVVDRKGVLTSTEQAATELVLGKGFTEGKYDPNNKKLNKNQYAAIFSAKDTLTDVYVRAYVDLGNDLIVYTDPVKLTNTSDFYNDAKLDVYSYTNRDTGKVTVSIDDTDNKDEVAQASGVAVDKIKIVKVGVVLDKKTPFGNFNTNNNQLAYEYNRELLYKVQKELVYDSEKFTIGTKSSNFGNAKTYTGKITPVSGKFLWYRSYAIYNINGKQVTIYGDIDATYNGDNVLYY